MKPILEIRGISKKFRIQHELEPYLTIRERMMQLIRFRQQKSTEDFWAVKDINFTVMPGESVGIVGRNGAGKSTLLKILSRITPPSKGSIISRGRIASLLEVGTGFHPELTGRENIFLNGSILGMKRKEIQQRFSAIVDFSGVEQFLDTPLKHYSSGMQLRLAFAVAAFLEPEILIIDEVLAVGDAEFQRKCMGKMDEVAKSGRTILFVSHNLGAVRNLCTRAVLLNKGSIEKDGTVPEVLDTYLESINTLSESRRKSIESNCGRFTLQLPYWVNEEGKQVDAYEYGQKNILRFEFDFKETVPSVKPGMALMSRDGSRIFTSHAVDDPEADLPGNLLGKVVIDTDLRLPELSPGTYQVLFGVADDKGHALVHANHEVEIVLHIHETNKHKDGANGLLWHTGHWYVPSR